MKNLIKNYLAAPTLIVAGFMTLLLFQNCTNDVAFDQNPSADRDPIANPGGLDGGGGDGQIGFGGNNDIVINFNEVPTDTTIEDLDDVVDYEVSVPGGSVQEIVCLYNGEEVDCDSVDRIPVNDPSLGENTFTIQVTDNQGRTIQEVITWDVYRELVMLTKTITVDTTSDQVDIIINVDNSGSMRFEQESMAGRIGNFMAPFAALDYNIAITTTSPSGGPWNSSLNYVDGKFVPLGNGTHCIEKSSGISTTDAQSLISANVVRDLYLRDSNNDPVVDPFADPNDPTPFYAQGSGWERGIFTTYRAIERDRGISGVQPDNCLRQNVAKHVVLISDERETLANEINFSPLPDLNKSDGDELKQLIASEYGANTVFKFHSIIVNPYTDEGAECLGIHGARPGVEYAELSVDTGGYIGSICAADYSSQLGEIGTQILNSSLVHTLDCVAVPSNGDTGTVTDVSTGNPVSVGYQFNGDKVEFAELLGPGDYEVSYYCFQ